MAETKQRNLRIGGGGYGAMMEDEGVPKPSPKVETATAAGSTTPRGGTGGGSTTPRGAAAK